MKKLQLKYYDDLGDIPYNFLVGDDGFVYEGRGFRHQGVIPDSQSASFGETGLIVAFIGTFFDRPPSRRQLDTFDTFLEQQVGRAMIDRNYKLFSEDQLTFTKPAAEGLNDAFKTRDDFYECKSLLWETYPSVKFYLRSVRSYQPRRMGRFGK